MDLLENNGVIKIRNDNTYYQVNLFKFRHFDTLTCYDVNSQTLMNDKTKTSNKILDMRGFTQINDHTFTITENNLVFYVVVLEHVHTMNAKSGQATTSKNFNMDLAMDVFNKYGYDAIQVSDEGIYATDCLSIMFIGEVNSFDIKPFVRNFIQKDHADVDQ